MESGKWRIKDILDLSNINIHQLSWWFFLSPIRAFSQRCALRHL